MLLPAARGPLTGWLSTVLGEPPARLAPTGSLRPAEAEDEDRQLALWVLYELHYRGFDDVDPGWEWNPSLLTVRAELEERFAQDLTEQVPPPALDDRPIAAQLVDLVRADEGPPLSRYLQTHATREQYEQFVTLRSVYHLKEADPHSWAIPRLSGRAKSALMEIQADEYGAGSPAHMHSELFRATMRGLGLDDTYGAYVGQAPAFTLAVSNLISFFGLHRERRGALVGHLAAFEMTSSLPNRRYSRGLARLGADTGTRRFYDEHVTADALHEQLAAHDLCGGLVEAEPQLAPDVLFGAACALYVDNRFAGAVLSAWEEGRSPLLATDGDVLALAADAG
ncbi:MAG: iron-containing redox enzyme family protein [bacterium]